MVMLNRLMRVLVTLLALGGLYVSVQALHVHNMDPGLAPPCAVTEQWDCGTVNHSKYSVFPPITFDEKPGTKHIPIATLGIIAYPVLAVCAAMGWWWITLQLSEMVFAGACMLSYLEAFVIQKWCIYCVWSQSLVTAILLCTIVALIARRRDRQRI
jgi:vitamin-K-epoxide reductase (warfarin-sensitive)